MVASEFLDQHSLPHAAMPVDSEPWWARLTADTRTARRDVRRRGARVQSQSTVPCGWGECARDLAHRESRRSRARHAMDRSSVPELHIVVSAGWFGRVDPCNLTVRIVRGRLGSL